MDFSSLTESFTPWFVEWTPKVTNAFHFRSWRIFLRTKLDSGLSKPWSVWLKPPLMSENPCMFNSRISRPKVWPSMKNAMAKRLILNTISALRDSRAQSLRREYLLRRAHKRKRNLKEPQSKGQSQPHTTARANTQILCRDQIFWLARNLQKKFQPR